MFLDEKFKKIRHQFPMFNNNTYGKPLVYFDNAATTQKPFVVIKGSEYFYSKLNANIHRGSYFLSQRSTYYVEKTRKKIQKFINAKYDLEIIFTKGTTDSINLVANSIESFINSGDEIIISYLEHHSNIIPWQILCNKKRAILKVIPIKKNGTLDVNKFKSLITKKTKIVSISHISNVLGIINPIKSIINISHEYGSLVLVDGAQAVSNCILDVQDLDVDFYVFSAHKMYGPTGIGILYGKIKILERMKPYQFGGGMIQKVNFTETIYADIPYKFEAGTQNIEGIYLFGIAIDFLKDIGINNIKHYNNNLTKYAIQKFKYIKDINLYGITSDIKNKSNIISFNLNKVHCFDVGCILDKMGISVRTGHICAQPIMSFFGISGVIRISFAMYNTYKEIDFFFECLIKVRKILKL